MIEADRADHSRAKLDHDLIVPITNFSRTLLSSDCICEHGGVGSLAKQIIILFIYLIYARIDLIASCYSGSGQEDTLRWVAGGGCSPPTGPRPDR